MVQTRSKTKHGDLEMRSDPGKVDEDSSGEIQNNATLLTDSEEIKTVLRNIHHTPLGGHKGSI